MLTGAGWNNTASLEQVLKVYDEFYPAMKSLLRMVNPEEIKLWRLLDRKALRTWISGKTCLIGDAAHPFLPRKTHCCMLFYSPNMRLQTKGREVRRPLKMYVSHPGISTYPAIETS